MKKIIYFLLTFIAFVIFFNIHVNMHQNSFPAITLQNIEALSDAESPNLNCVGLGSVDCPDEETKVKYLF